VDTVNVLMTVSEVQKIIPYLGDRLVMVINGKVGDKITVQLHFPKRHLFWVYDILSEAGIGEQLDVTERP
jgi:hypothetical protein